MPNHDHLQQLFQDQLTLQEQLVDQLEHYSQPQQSNQYGSSERCSKAGFHHEQQSTSPQYSNVIHYAASQGFVDMLKKMLSANPNELEFVDSVSDFFIFFIFYFFIFLFISSPFLHRTATPLYWWHQ